MRDVGNASNCREDFNVDGHVFQEVKIFKYISALITGKTELVTKSRRKQVNTIYVIIVDSIL
jgi:hypothetical protein